MCSIDKSSNERQYDWMKLLEADGGLEESYLEARVTQFIGRTEEAKCGLAELCADQRRSQLLQLLTLTMASAYMYYVLCIFCLVQFLSQWFPSIFSWWVKIINESAGRDYPLWQLIYYQFQQWAINPSEFFSGARRTVSWEMAQMGAETLEMVEFLKYWEHSMVEIFMLKKCHFVWEYKFAARSYSHIGRGLR